MTDASILHNPDWAGNGWMDGRKRSELFYLNIKMQYLVIQEGFVFNVEAQTRVDVDTDDGTQQTAATDIYLCIQNV